MKHLRLGCRMPRPPITLLLRLLSACSAAELELVELTVVIPSRPLTRANQGA